MSTSTSHSDPRVRSPTAPAQGRQQGEPVEPMHDGLGTDVKALLRRHRPDPNWAGDLDDVRALLEIDNRS